MDDSIPEQFTLSSKIGPSPAPNELFVIPVNLSCSYIRESVDSLCRDGTDTLI